MNMRVDSCAARPPRPLVTRLACALLCTALAGAPTVQAQSSNARFRGEPVTLNFVNADIEGVTRAVGAILKQQFVVDPRVKGTITLYSDEALLPREVYLNYLAALRGLGFTVVEAGGLFKVVPEADAKLQTGTVSVGEVPRKGDQVLTQIFRLNHENANNLVAVLRPLISPNNTINANPGNNTLVITDYADNLTRLGKIIAAMDTPAAGEVEIIPLQHAVASDVAALVQRLAESTAAPGVAPGIAPPSVLIDSRSNSLIVRAANPARLASIRAIIDKLDRPTKGSGVGGNIYVVPLKNADAVKLAAVLRAAFGGGGSGSSSSTTTGVNTFTQGATAVGTAGTGPLGGTSAAANAPLTASASPSTGGFIQADPSANSLVITAPEPLYKQLRAVIDQLDSRRAQVYIESMIVEVSGDNAADFGFQWQGLIGNKGDKNIGVGGTNFDAAGNPNNNIIDLAAAVVGGRTTAGVAAGKISEGLNIGLIRNYGGIYGLSAIARVLQSQANTNIVSTPNLITLDNEEAKIVVGQNVPFITGQFTNTGTATTSPFQTIERKDVGITLRIRPQIGENGTVRMVIFQESSSVADTTAVGTGSAGPTTNKRSIESTVVVDDGAILVLGGLIEDRFTNSRSQIPLLGDIPYVGALFRSENRTKKRTNLMVFLRPVVMRDADSANRLSLDRYDLIRSLQKDQQPERSVMLPINEAPVLPPSGRVEESTLPLAVPPSPAAKPASAASN